MLVVLMVMSMIPAISVSAVSVWGAIGNGSQANPLVCDNFGELKAALELDTAEDVYIKLVNGKLIDGVSAAETLTALSSAQHAINQVGNKYLIVEGDVKYVANKGSKYIDLISVGGYLHVSGSGSITYNNKNVDVECGIIAIRDNENARLAIQSDVSLHGDTAGIPAYDTVLIHALYANSGAVLVENGTFHSSVAFPDDYQEAGTLLTGDVHAYISGGYFYGDVPCYYDNEIGIMPDYGYIVGMKIQDLTDKAYVSLTGGTYKGLYNYKVKLRSIVPDYCVFFDEIEKVIVEKTSFPYAINYISFDDQYFNPMTILKIPYPEVVEWEPFFNNGKSTMDITLLKGKQYGIKCNATDLPEELTERGFWIRRSYTLEDTAAGYTDTYWTEDNMNFAKPYTFTKTGTAKLQICFQVMYDYEILATRYYTYNITISDKESLGKAEFNFSAPMVGQTPGGVAVVGGEVDYDFEGAWYELNGVYDSGMPMVGKQLTSSDKFVSGKQYMAAVRITLPDNMDFTSNFTAYINGNKANFFGNFSTSERGAIVWVPFTPYEKAYYADLTVKVPVEGETIGNPLTAANVYIPTIGTSLARWTDANGNLVSGEFVGGYDYYLTYLVRSKNNSTLPTASQADYRVNGVTPDSVEVYNASSGGGQILRITHKFHCVDEIEFYFTEDSYCEAGGTMTVDIERIVEQSDELLNAYFDGDYSVQWYRDGEPLDGATELSLSFLQRDTLYHFSCELTVGDTVITSDEYLCVTHVHKYDESYEYDEEEHWHGCIDENCPDYEDSITGGAHTFTEKSGCLVCGYNTVAKGDVNADGAIDQFDYILVKRHYFETRLLTDDELPRADVNSDGAIDQFDYILIKRHYFGTYVIGG